MISSVAAHLPGGSGCGLKPTISARNVRRLHRTPGVGLLLILNRNRDKSEHSCRKLQFLLLDERAARVEHPHDEGPRGVSFGFPISLGFSDSVDVNESNFAHP